MENATYIGLSYQAALERQMNVVANNIANMSTPGFKARQIMFKEHLVGPERDTLNSYNQVQSFAEYMDTAAGSYAQTGRTLDVALQGPGYMGVIVGDKIHYTRAGHFALNSVGEIVGPGGLRVADSGGSPITIPDGAKEIKIGEDGTVNVDGNSVGTLMIREFADQQVLTPVGNSMFAAPAGEEGVEAENTTMQQGMLEGSNVNSVMESSNMIEIMRNYQSVQRMLQSESDRMRSAIQRLSGRGN